jgi:hypothetical protein
MKHCCLLLLALTVPGCFTFPFAKKEDDRAATTVVRNPPVMPEQVKETNAHKVAASLEEEVNVDETTPVTKPEEKKPVKK